MNELADDLTVYWPALLVAGVEAGLAEPFVPAQELLGHTSSLLPHLEIHFALELRLDALLQVEALGTRGLALAVAQPLLVAIAAVLCHQPGKAFRFQLTGNQRFDEGNIDTDTIGDATGANAVGVKFRNNMQLLLAGEMALPGVAPGRRRCTHVDRLVHGRCFIS